MKVMCINDEAWPPNVVFEKGSKIETGKTYDVIDVFFGDGCVWYELSIDEGFGYWENCFARISNVSETEFERNYNLQKV